MECTLCPQLKFKVRRAVFSHVLEFHVPEAPDDIISQYDHDMNEDLDIVNDDQRAEEIQYAKRFNLCEIV